jgi:hypothetical protein
MMARATVATRGVMVPLVRKKRLVLNASPKHLMVPLLGKKRREINKALDTF